MTDGTFITSGLNSQAPATINTTSGQVSVRIESPQIQSIPSKVAQLPSNTNINGRVEALSQNGQAIIATAQGKIDVLLSSKTAASLQQGQPVDIQLLKTTPQNLALRLQFVLQSTQSEATSIASNLKPQQQRGGQIDDVVLTQSAVKIPQISVEAFGAGNPRAPEQIFLQLLVSGKPTELQMHTTIRLLPIDNLVNLRVETPNTSQVLPNRVFSSSNLASSGQFISEGINISPLKNIITTRNLIAQDFKNAFSSAANIYNIGATIPLPETGQGIRNLFSAVFSDNSGMSLVMEEPRILPRRANQFLSLQTSLKAPEISQPADSAQVLKAPGLRFGDIISLTELQSPEKQYRLFVQDIQSPLSEIGEAKGQPAAPISMNQFLGQVVGVTQTKFPIVQLFYPSGEEAGRYAMNLMANNLPVGTSIVFETLGVGSIIPPPQSHGVHAVSQQNWPALEQLFKQILLQTPSTATTVQRALLPAIPQVNNASQLTASSLFFIAAVAIGDVKNWLPQRLIETFQRLKISTDKLSNDILQMRQTALDAPVTEWRGFSLPLLTQNHLSRMDLYYREETDNGLENSGGSATRFIMDIHLSRMGGIQIDGLIRCKRLDVMLRSEKAFSDTMRQQMRHLFQDAISGSGYEGDISFRGSSEEMLDIRID